MSSTLEVIANVTIENSSYEKLLGVTIDSKLKLDKHAENSCKTSKIHGFI